MHATWCWSAPNLSEIFSWHGVLSYRCWRMRWIACLFSTLILHRCWLSTTLVSMLSTSGASHHCTRLHRKAGRSSARCWWACFYFHCYIWIHILLLISTCFWSDSAVVQYYVSRYIKNEKVNHSYCICCLSSAVHHRKGQHSAKAPTQTRATLACSRTASRSFSVPF